MMTENTSMNNLSAPNPDIAASSNPACHAWMS